MNKLEMRAPEVIPEPGWTPLMPFPKCGEGQPFLTGDTSENRLRVAYFLRESDAVVCARAWFGWAAEGPPGHAHGGSILTVLDEVMGMATWCAGYLAIAASVTAHFRKKIPLGADTTAEAWVCGTERRKIYTQATLCDVQGKSLFAEAEGLYVMQDIERFGGDKTLRKVLQEQQKK